MTDSLPGQLVYPFGMGSVPDQPVSASVLGGKGASLAEMARAGFPVPPGFTICTACCGWVEQHGGAWPPGLEDQVRQAMQQLEQATERTFGRGTRPLYVAVRSGAAVSMPGMMDTILNCGQDPSIEPWDALCQAINNVFNSWNSERAVAYRQHHDVKGILGTAVNVQSMFPSERSGVLFTSDPNRPSSGEMVLEASWGLGEAVVSGDVTPDIYYLDAVTLETKRVVAGSRPASDPALTEQQRQEVGRLGQKIVAHFGVPSDIEWGIADNKVALLQTRQIRGLDVLQDAERGRVEEIQRLKSLAAREPAFWVVHNLSETLAAPTLLTWDLMRWFMSAQGGYGQMYRLLGHRPQERVPGQGFLELIGGRIYVDPRRAAEFHFGRMPFEYDVDEAVRDRTSLDRPPTRFNFDRTDSLFFFRLPGLLFHMIRGARRMKAMSQAPAVRFQNVALPRLEQFLNQSRSVDLTSLPTGDLIRELHQRRDYVLGQFAAESLIPGFFGGLAYVELRQILVQLLGAHEGETLASQLTTGLEGDVTARQNIWLFEVAQGQRPRTDFLEAYGHRAVNEMELSQPRWREDDSFVDRMIEQFRTSPMAPRERHEAQVKARQEAEQSLPVRLSHAGGSSLSERVIDAMRRACELMPYRELGKFHLMRGYEALRAVLTELAVRWDLGRDLFMLQLDELSGFEQNPDSARKRIAQRKLRWRSLQKLSLPDVIDSRDLEDFGRSRRSVSATGQTYTCRPIASGVTRGRARIVFDPGSVQGLGRDDILVCPSTDPGWTPLFVTVRGLIVERGGVLSHGAIVARDFGIPAVVLEEATQLIPEGATLEIDADHGTVVIQTAAVQADTSAVVGQTP